MSNAAKEEKIVEGPEMTDIESDLDDVINRLEETTEETESTEDGTILTKEAPDAEYESLDDDSPAEPAPEPEAAPAPKYSAPVDWPDEIKTSFGELPEKVQEQIHRREVNVNRLLQETSQQRRVAETFEKVVEPYRGLMASEGIADPLQAVHGLMATTAILAMGQPEQKAKKIADLVKHYHIDIETLDRALSGQIETPQVDPMQQQLMSRLQTMEQRLQQQDQMRSQAVSSAAQTSIEAFASDPANEHFGQVREIMADFLDLATQHGQVMSLEDAYRRACAAHPEVSAQIGQRNIQQSAPNMSDKRRAAASVKPPGATAPETASTEGMDIRDILEKSIPGTGARL